MADESFQDKTEPATPKRKEESRKKGQVAKSKEISSIAVLSAGVLYLFFNAKDLTLKLGDIMRQTFHAIPQLKLNDHNLPTLLSQALERYFWLILPIMLVLCAVALLSNYLQTGIIWSVDPLTPKASKIDPIKGISKLISKRSFVELAKSVLKIVVVGWVAFSLLKSESDHLVPLMYQEKVQIISYLGHIALKIFIRCCCAIAILAILDFIYQKWEFEQNMKMTKQEVKDEFKQVEGDPLVKSRIKSIQREMARRRMMEEVPKADVVITNPTHLSVALRYDTEERMASPRVVAKGANMVAFRIREIAVENDIPLVENKMLAQNLYKLELGEEIPPQFYQAVAEILAYVYGLKKKKA
ncbi:MAG: flagellar biosynthesis protein FlhB [Deltaproteobacteria bacterium]|nr:flagellar biosynthesis protein FlhB [Deltaproteobacteria bacterium]